MEKERGRKELLLRVCVCVYVCVCVCVCVRDCYEMNATTVEAPVSLLAATHEGHIYIGVAVVLYKIISQQILPLFSDRCSSCFSPAPRRICSYILPAP